MKVNVIDHTHGVIARLDRAIQSGQKSLDYPIKSGNDGGRCVLHNTCHDNRSQLSALSYQPKISRIPGAMSDVQWESHAIQDHAFSKMDYPIKSGNDRFWSWGEAVFG